MNTKEVIEAIREVLSKHVGDEKELMEQLDAEAEGWRMRLDELDEEE